MLSECWAAVMLTAVRVTEVPSEPCAEWIQTECCFTFFFFKKMDKCERFFFMFDCCCDIITNFIKNYTYSTIYLTDINNVQSQLAYKIWIYIFVIYWSHSRYTSCFFHAVRLKPFHRMHVNIIFAFWVLFYYWC